MNMDHFEAPHFAELDAIAKRIGYGRACQILGELWDQMLEREYGRPSGRGKMERRRDIEEIEALIQSRAAPAVPKEIETRVKQLIEDASIAGQVVTISTEPRHPLAMGNYRLVYDIRPGRHRGGYYKRPQE